MCKSWGTDGETREIQRTAILITLPPKDSVLAGYLPRNIELFYCFGGFLFPNSLVQTNILQLFLNIYLQM